VGKEKGQTSDYMSHEQYIQEGISQHIYGNLPFFRKFRILRLFKQWKVTMRINSYERKRKLLAQNFVFGKQMFGEKFPALAETMNSYRHL